MPKKRKVYAVLDLPVGGIVFFKVDGNNSHRGWETMESNKIYVMYLNNKLLLGVGESGRNYAKVCC
jgi:hypothetical protein